MIAQIARALDPMEYEKVCFYAPGVAQDGRKVTLKLATFEVCRPCQGVGCTDAGELPCPHCNGDGMVRID